ncbi:TMEM53 family protein [Sphingomonas xinjiangensis]|uniref:Uncharacterized protein n=1 Tax=Sphingomonas xinjiangensis TaxID=643568 RepID=A0A840Y8T2_9SPHN|nr:TMEM53 family protein [Sphingomonas xinjiangensis]MBB5709737.1 hypothetical protein [Sphingomonas xinjiangensis]
MNDALRAAEAMLIGKLGKVTLAEIAKDREKRYSSRGEDIERFVENVRSRGAFVDYHRVLGADHDFEVNKTIAPKVLPEVARTMCRFLIEQQV